jgi:ABC-2 type transport system ATP-binding protein
LDILARRELWREIEKLKGGTAVILTTHYLEEAEALADRIGVMTGGRLTAAGTAAELKAAAGKDSFEDAFVELASGGAQV